jgi:hypothetical protein
MEAAARQLQQLMEKGPVLVPSGGRTHLFTVTNIAGATYEGFFELRAPVSKESGTNSK